MFALRHMGPVHKLLGILLILATVAVRGECGESGQTVWLLKTAEFDASTTASEYLIAPVDVCCDKAGFLYVADQSADRILKLTPEGKPIGQFGGFGEDRGRLNGPVAIATDGINYLYVTESGNRRVQKFDTKGSSIAVFGTDLEAPRGLAVQGDVVCLTDAGKDKVLLFDDGKLSMEIGDYGWGEGYFVGPCDVDADRLGDLFVVDRGNKRVQVFDRNGRFLLSFGSGVLRDPAGIAVSAGNKVFVSDSDSREVLVFSGAGKRIGSTYKSGLESPAGICCHADRIFVADTVRRKIVVFRLQEASEAEKD